MEKRMLVLLIILGLLGSVPAYAQEGAVDPKRDEMRKKIEGKKKELNGTEWEVTLKSSSGKGAFSGADVLTFQDNVFQSRSSANAGFTPTNYTLTVSESEDGPTVWETMQTGSKGDVLFWRGEWSGNKMSGVLSRQLENGKSEEYGFSSSAMKDVPEISASASGEAVKEEKSSGKKKK